MKIPPVFWILVTIIALTADLSATAVAVANVVVWGGLIRLIYAIMEHGNW